MTRISIFIIYLFRFSKKFMEIFDSIKNIFLRRSCLATIRQFPRRRNYHVQTEPFYIIPGDPASGCPRVALRRSYRSYSRSRVATYRSLVIRRQERNRRLVIYSTGGRGRRFRSSRRHVSAWKYFRGLRFSDSFGTRSVIDTLFLRFDSIKRKTHVEFSPVLIRPSDSEENDSFPNYNFSRYISVFNFPLIFQQYRRLFPSPPSGFSKSYGVLDIPT